MNKRTRIGNRGVGTGATSPSKAGRVANPPNACGKDKGGGGLQAEVQRLGAQVAVLETAHEEQYRVLFELGPNPMFVFDEETLRFLAVNEAALRQYGYSRAEFLKLGVTDIRPPAEVPLLKEALHKQRLAKAMPGGEWRHCRKDGTPFDVEATVSAIPFNGRRARLVTATDITARKRAETLLQSRFRLTEVMQQASIEDLTQAILDEAEALTGSQIGFFHLVNEAEKSLTLQAWSTNTLKGMCQAEGKGQHYAIDKAGVWVDCFHARAPVIHNDYASLPHKKGLPPGHARVVRELGVPIFRNGAVVAIMGVGNKATEYTQEDVEVVQIMASTALDLVARRQADQALKDTERQLRLAVEGADLGAWSVQLDKNLFTASARARELHGFAPDEPLTRERCLAAVHPEDRTRLAVAVTRTLAKGERFAQEYRVLLPGGAVRWMAAQGRLFSDTGNRQLHGIVYDITARKRAEEALRDSEARFRRLLHQAPIPLCFVNKQGELAYFNDRFVQTFGYTHEDVPTLNKWWLRAYPDEKYCAWVVATWDAAVLRAAQTQSDITPMEYNVTCKDGTVRIVEISGITIEDNFLATFIDLTERKRLERELQEANAHLEQQVEERTRELRMAYANLKDQMAQRERAEQVRRQVEAIARGRERLALLGELAAGVAHELRNPLQGVMGFLDIVKMRTRAQPDVTPLVQRIEGGLHDMDKLAEQLLDLARPSQEPAAAAELGPLVERAWSFLRVEAAKKRMELKLAIVPGLPPVCVNPSRMVEALLNLFKNSMDACPAGGIVTVAAQPQAKQPGMVEVLVSDNGTGVPEELWDKVFEPFFTTKESGKGTGLGLPMVRRTVESFGGYVELVRAPGPGVAFRLVLPVATERDNRPRSRIIT
ncbi:MAG: PAS domain S-box protein [Planctomycetota bacterium]